jgi:hypothetical protein
MRVDTGLLSAVLAVGIAWHAGAEPTTHFRDVTERSGIKFDSGSFDIDGFEFVDLMARVPLHSRTPGTSRRGWCAPSSRRDRGPAS